MDGAAPLVQVSRHVLNMSTSITVFINLVQAYCEDYEKL